MVTTTLTDDGQRGDDHRRARRTLQQTHWVHSPRGARQKYMYNRPPRSGELERETGDGVGERRRGRSVGLTNTLAGGGSSAAAFGPCLRRAGRPQRHSQSRQHHYGEPAGLGASLRIALKSGERLMRGVTKIYLCNVAEPPANGGIKAVTKNGINKKTHKQRWTFEWSSTTTPMSPCRECVSSCIVPRPKDLHTLAQKKRLVFMIVRGPRRRQAARPTFDI